MIVESSPDDKLFHDEPGNGAGGGASDFSVAIDPEFLPPGVIPFHDVAGTTAGAAFVHVDDPDAFVNDGDSGTVGEVIPLDIFDKYDSLLLEGVVGFETTDFGDHFVAEYDFLLVSATPILAAPGILPPQAGVGDVGRFSEGAPTIPSFVGDNTDDPLDIFDKYDDVELLSAVVAVFIEDFGDQLVIEYDFFVAIDPELLPLDMAPFHAGAGATAGAVLVHGADDPLDMFDKYDDVELLPEVVAVFIVDFGDQLVIE